jgi:hypothetical protein
MREGARNSRYGNLPPESERYPSSMPSSRDTRATGGQDAARMTRWERLKYALVRPDDEPAHSTAPAGDRSAEEVRAVIRRADDKERAVGLIAAPVSAAISFIVITALIDRNSVIGAKHYTPASTYHELLLVLLAFAVLMLVSALTRKRLFLAISLALYGLALFQLGWLGFAVPFVLAGAWYLVRSYRLQQELRRAEPADVRPTRAKGATNGVRPRSSKRYTPPA